MEVWNRERHCIETERGHEMAVISSAYLDLFTMLIKDVQEQIPEYTLSECTRDIAYITARHNAESYTFIMKTLPALGKALERALETGTFAPLPGLKREKGKRTPCLFRALFKEVFNEHGELCATRPDIVRALRQICYFSYKLEADYPQEVVDERIAQFVHVDESLPDLEELSPEANRVLKVARRVLGNLFRDFDHRSIIPRPGPGTSADGTAHVYRFEPVVHHSSVHAVYPYYTYFYVSTDHLGDRLPAYRSLPRKASGTSLMRLVPKDSRGPRVICMEPQDYMFLQQGLGDAMRKHIASNRMTRGRVNFVNQEVNRQLAYGASVTGCYATLDMKDASDRISKDLVWRLFSEVPDMRSALFALSTEQTELPDGSIVQTRKFAPMGSSLCFPVMSIVHYALALACIRVREPRTFKALAKDSVYVYGDDIIVKTAYASHLLDLFPNFGLMFNRDKSFISGDFRESCGMDAYKGVCVTPLRLKKRIFDTNARVAPDVLLAARDMEYNLRKAGYTRAAQFVADYLQETHGMVNRVAPGSPVLGMLTDDIRDVSLNYKRKYRSSTQSFWYRVPVIRRRARVSFNGCWERLLKCLLLSSEETKVVGSRDDVVRTTYAWVPLQALYGSVSPVYRF